MSEKHSNRRRLCGTLTRHTEDWEPARSRFLVNNFVSAFRYRGRLGRTYTGIDSVEVELFREKYAVLGWTADGRAPSGSVLSVYCLGEYSGKMYADLMFMARVLCNRRSRSRSMTERLNPVWEARLPLDEVYSLSMITSMLDRHRNGSQVFSPSISSYAMIRDEVHNRVLGRLSFTVAETIQTITAPSVEVPVAAPEEDDSPFLEIPQEVFDMDEALTRRLIAEAEAVRALEEAEKIDPKEAPAKLVVVTGPVRVIRI